MIEKHIFDMKKNVFDLSKHIHFIRHDAHQFSFDYRFTIRRKRMNSNTKSKNVN